MFGGMSAFEYYLCKTLARMGHEVTLLTSNIPPGRTLLPRKERFSSEGEVEDAFLVKRASATFNLGGDMPIMPLLRLELKKLEADIVHAHEYYNYSSLVSWTSSRARRIPFTYTQDRYYSVKRKAWQPFFRFLNGTLLRSVRNSPKLVTAFSKAAADYLSGQGYPQERISTIPLGVDTGKFSPAQEGWLRSRMGFHDDLVVMSVARLHPSKNLESLINAVRKVSAQKRNVKLVIVGRGPHLIRLESQVRDLGLEDLITFYTEPVPYSEMPGLYNSCDLFVLPSFYEPFGMAVLEAMACGKPALVSDVGGMRDTVVNGETGFKIPLNNRVTFVNQLASKIIDLLDEPDSLHKIGRAARRRVELLYDWQIIARRYDEFYRMLAN